MTYLPQNFFFLDLENTTGKNEEVINIPGRLTAKGVIGVQFRSPFKCLLVGPSNSGKTTLLHSILQTDNIFNTKFHCITYHYSEHQPLFDEIKKSVKDISFVEGLPEKIERHDNDFCLLILDDLLTDASNSEIILDLFLKKSHHLGKSLFFLSQNLFYSGKYFRNLSLNSDYFIMFKPIRDKLQALTFFRQVFPEKHSFNCGLVHSIMREPYSYLMLDLKQDTKDNLRIWGNITTDMPVVYTCEY